MLCHCVDGIFVLFTPGGGDEKVFQSGDALPRFTDPAAAHLSLDELPPVTGEGNQWISKLMKMPSSMVTGPVSDTTALYSGTFSDESTAEEARQSDLYVLMHPSGPA